MPSEIIAKLKAGDPQAIARAISMVENRVEGSAEILQSLDSTLAVPVVGFTGPPGAGKSSIVNEVAALWAQNQKVAIVAVDPASPFNFGSLLGDRLRMSSLFTNPNIFIRSISSRGSLGGLSASIIEITDVLKNAGFQKIIIETVGVGQSEVEIAGIADTTIVVTVPESGDEVQTLKSGVMEIADVFVVNKSDRQGADSFFSYLRELSNSKSGDWKIPVIKTIAIERNGIEALCEAIELHGKQVGHSKRKFLLLAQKLEMLVIRERMQDFDLQKIADELETEMNKPGFNLYVYSKKFLS